MATNAFFEKQAKDCEANAWSAPNARMRDQWLTMAKQWRRLINPKSPPKDEKAD